MEKIMFALTAVPGPQEWQAVLLVESVRRWGGAGDTFFDDANWADGFPMQAPLASWLRHQIGNRDADIRG